MAGITIVMHDLTQIVLLTRRASMSTSYKPALLKALARIVRRQPAREIPLTTIGAEFVRMYWNQTVIFHLRQAAVLTKETEVVKAIRQSSHDNERRAKIVVPSAFGSPLVSIDQVGKYYDAALAVEWPSGWAP